MKARFIPQLHVNVLKTMATVSVLPFISRASRFKCLFLLQVLQNIICIAKSHSIRTTQPPLAINLRALWSITYDVCDRPLSPWFFYNTSVIHRSQTEKHSMSKLNHSSIYSNNYPVVYEYVPLATIIMLIPHSKIQWQKVIRREPCIASNAHNASNKSQYPIMNAYNFV